MKKFVYLCGLLFVSISMNGQINTNDGWNLILNEQFAGTNRGWGQNFQELQYTYLNTIPMQAFRWCACCPEYRDGVTIKGRYQAYQRSNAVFIDNKMRLRAEYVSSTPLICGGSRPTGYEYPVDSWHECNYNDPSQTYYYSGVFQSNQQLFHYGYYEAECAFPVHNGAHASFWLWGNYTTATDSIYEEIDIMEYCINNSEVGNPQYEYSSGIWYNGQTIHLDYYHDHYGCSYINMPETGQGIKDMHTYGCEWMPDHIIFYRDGEVTSEFYDSQHIPQHEKFLKVSYSIDKYALKKPHYDTPDWLGQDSLTINQIKVYYLTTDCGTDALVQNAVQFNQINSMKRSITISNPNGITLPSNTDKTLRASDYFQIEGPFEVAAGAQITLMVHECPN